VDFDIFQDKTRVGDGLPHGVFRQCLAIGHQHIDLQLIVLVGGKKRRSTVKAAGLL